MHRRQQRVSLLLLLLVLGGCGEKERLGPDYVLVTPESWNPDGHPGTALHYKGRVFWPNVYHTPAGWSFREGIFVFSSPVPGRDGGYDYGISPQLFAVMGAGPPVIISERIVPDALGADSNYQLWEVRPTETGVRAEFTYWPDHHHQARLIRDVSWADIRSWLREAEVSAPDKTSALGTYRILRKH